MKIQSSKRMPSILLAATVLFVLTSRIVWAEAGGTSGTGTAPAPMSTLWVGGSILFLLVVVLLFGAYMFYLQREFLSACRESNQLPLFFNKPAGLPEGTVRSILTLLIIIFSLYLFILAAAGVGRFPEALGAILSAIIGFYFGHRSMSGKDDKTIENLKTQLDDASAGKDQSRAQQVVGKIGKNIQLLKTVMDVLPAETQKKYEPLLDKLQKGSAAAGALLDSGAFSQAAEKAQSLYDAFKQGNPLKSIVQKASLSFAAVAGGVPPLAIIAAVVGVSATAAGVAYSRWKARLLNTPLSPSVAPLKMVDTDTCIATMLGIPALKTAFKEKLAQRDGAFLEQLMNDFLRKEVDALWPVYGQPYGFDSLEDFREAVQAFRMALAGREIETEADPAVFAKTGGYQSFMKAIDQIRADKTAGADLDRLMEVVDGLKKTDEPLAAIFEKVRKEVETS